MKTTIELSDKVKEFIKTGNADLFTGIYEESYGYLHTCAIHVMKNEDETQDILQDAYIEIFRNLSSLKDPDSFLGWAATITNRKCFAALKKDRDILVDERVDDEGNVSDFFDNIKDDEAFIPENILDNEENCRLIRQIVDGLNEAQRLCVISYFFNEKKQDEIAEEFGMPLNTVKSHLNRAKARIKEAVVDMEKNKGTKLYAIAPFMLLLFAKEAKACDVPPMPKALSEVVEESVRATEKVGQAAGATAKKAAGVMSGKNIVITGIALLVAAGVISAVVINSNHKGQNVVDEAVAVHEDESDKENAISEVATDNTQSNEQANVEIEQELATTDMISEDIQKTAELLLDCSEYESIGFAYGGVIPVQKNGLWGAVNYEGEEVVPIRYSNFFRAPDNEGLFILQDGNGTYYLFNADGELLYQGADEVMASGSFYAVMTGNIDGDWQKSLVKYYDLNGNEVAQTVRFDSADLLYGSCEDGITVYENYESEEENHALEKIGILRSSGNIDWLGTLYDGKIIQTADGKDVETAADAQSMRVRLTQCPVSGVNNGYFLMFARSTPDFGVELYSTDLEKIGSLDCVKLVGNGDNLSSNESSFNEENWFRSYFLDGASRVNYGSKVVASIDGRDYLLDLSKVGENNSNLSEALICSYDGIYMSDSELWLVNKGDEWGYIDQSGRELSMFEDASSFVNGCALIRENGEAILIDEQMNKLQVLGEATSVSADGEMLMIRNDGQILLYVVK